MDSARIIPVDGRCPQSIFGTPIAPSGYSNFVQPIISVRDARVGDETGIKGEQFIASVTFTSSASTSQGGNKPGMSLRAHIVNELLSDALENIAKVVDFANIFVGSSLASFASNAARKAAATDRLRVITVVDAAFIAGTSANLVAWEIADGDPFINNGTTSPYNSLPENLPDVYNGLTSSLGDATFGMVAINSWPENRTNLGGTNQLFAWPGIALGKVAADNSYEPTTRELFPFVLPGGSHLNLSFLTPGGGNASWPNGAMHIAWREFAA
jgi:hypothetical protein